MNNKEIVQNISKKICNNMGYNPETDDAGSILVILALTGIVLSLIRIIQECNSNKMSKMNEKEKTEFLQKRIKELCSGNNFLNKWRLKRIIKKHLSPADYAMMGKQTTDAIIKAGMCLEYSECGALLGEANNV